MLRLLAWTGVIAAFLLLPVSRKLERRREHAVDAVSRDRGGSSSVSDSIGGDRGDFSNLDHEDSRLEA